MPVRQLGTGETRRLDLELHSPARDASGARQAVHMETVALRVRALKARIKDAVRRGPPMIVAEVCGFDAPSRESKNVPVIAGGWEGTGTGR